MRKRLQAVAAVALLAVTAAGAAEPVRDEETPPAPTTEVSARPDSGIVAAPAPDPRVLALGRHLARDCTSCHRADGHERGIPKITGMAPQQMQAALEAYRTGARNNPVMGSVARTLGPEQVEALAAYYAALKAQ